jgi:chaperone modulatory protein CbpM
MMTDRQHLIIEEVIELGLDELCRSLRCDVELIVTLVHEGALEAHGEVPAHWRFAGMALQRARRAVRLARDLELNPPGVALALQLLDQIRELELQLGRQS